MKKEKFIEKYGEEEYLKRLEIINEYGDDEQALKSALSREHYYRNKEHYQQVRKDYYQNNKEHLKEYSKTYYADNKKGTPEWTIENRERMKQYTATHRDVVYRNIKKYTNTIKGRSKVLARTYNRQNKLMNREDCSISDKWIIENVFNKKCVFCGEDDYHKLGVIRIDRNLPYTEDNCQCCCKKCNNKRRKRKK